MAIVASAGGFAAGVTTISPAAIDFLWRGN